MADYLVRVMSDTKNVIGLACLTTDLVGAARQVHQTSRTATAALGRALTGGLLMGALLKRGQKLALKFEGNGPLKKIIVEADNAGTARGFVAVPDADVPLKDEKLNVSGALGSQGFLNVIKDLGLKEPYRGVVKLSTGEIAEDIAYYYAESEQIPSAMGLGVFVNTEGKVLASGGFLLQSLPPSEERTVDRLIENIRKIPPVTDLLRQGQRPEEMLKAIFAGVPFYPLGRKDLSYRCTCSRDRIERVLISLGADELRRLINGVGETDVTCEFCRSQYHFSKEELEQLEKKINSAK
jgi:molecular chaperone Hsp33